MALSPPKKVCSLAAAYLTRHCSQYIAFDTYIAPAQQLHVLNPGMACGCRWHLALMQSPSSKSS